MGLEEGGSLHCPVSATPEGSDLGTEFSSTQREMPAVRCKLMNLASLVGTQTISATQFIKQAHSIIFQFKCGL